MVAGQGALAGCLAPLSPLPLSPGAEPLLTGFLCGRLQLCGLTSACCLALSSALTSSKTLRSLDLSENALDLSGLLVLVSALRQPTCALEVLG